VAVTVNPGKSKPVVRTEIPEASALERTVEVEAGIIPILMAPPAIVINVGTLIDPSVLIGVIFRMSTLRPALWGRRNPATIPVVNGRTGMLRRSGTLLATALLRKCGPGKNKNYCENRPDELLHKTSIEHTDKNPTELSAAGG